MGDFDWSLMGDYGVEPEFDWSLMGEFDLTPADFEIPSASYDLLGPNVGLQLDNGSPTLAGSFTGGAPGMYLNDTPGIDSMDGGQGLTLDTSDLTGFWADRPGGPTGTISELGLFPDSYTPALGDPNSFINDSSRPVDGRGNIVGGSGSLATGSGSLLSPAVRDGTAGQKEPTAGDKLKELLNGNGGLNKLGLSALLAALLRDKDGGSGAGKGAWVTPNTALQYQRTMKPQDPNRRPGSANPGGYFTPVTYAAQGGLMKPAHRMKAGGGVQGLLKGPGDGMSDSIPAQIDGQDPAQVATGEFIVPADVVSALGAGDTDAGAQRLQEMLSRVRTEAHGHDKQIRPVSDKTLPT